MPDLPHIPLSPLEITRAPGKCPGSLITVIQQVFGVKMYEYTHAHTWRRSWDYTDGASAVQALNHYLTTDGARGPAGYIRTVINRHMYQVDSDGNIFIPDFIPDQQ